MQTMGVESGIDLGALANAGSPNIKMDLDDILWEANVEFGAGSVSIMLPDEKRHLKIHASYGIDLNIIKYTCVDGGCTKGYGSVSPCVYRTGRARLVDTDPEVVGVNYSSNSMCVPIYSKGEVIGVFNFSNKKEGNFSGDDLLRAIRFTGRHSSDISSHCVEPERYDLPEYHT